MERLEILTNHIKPKNSQLNKNTTSNTDYVNQFKKDSKLLSIFGDIKEAPADAILGLNTGFKNDKSDKKVNLGVGACKI